MQRAVGCYQSCGGMGIGAGERRRGCWERSPERGRASRDEKDELSRGL